MICAIFHELHEAATRSAAYQMSGLGYRSIPTADALEWPVRTERAAVVEIDWEALPRVFAPQNLDN